MQRSISKKNGVFCVAALAGLAASALASCADAGPYNPGDLAPTDRAQVAGLCTGVMGLPGGDQLSNACLESLSASLRDVAGSRTLATSQADCLRQGLPPGSPALAQCELDRSRAIEDGRRISAVLPEGPPMRVEPRRTYWSSSNAEIHRREQTACAHLGLEPAGSAFAQCVASLDVALFAATNLSQ